MTKPIGVKLDDDLHIRLKALGERCERSPHWLMKKAISEFVDRMEENENEKKILFERWNRYQETNQSVSHEEVTKWLKTWGTEKESSCPSIQN